jgi:iron complex outermembrane recepter protein
MKTKLLIINILLLLLRGGASAQAGQIQGIVTNNEGKAAQAVSILLKETQQGVISGEKGEFLITNIKADDYTLIASFVGYKTLEKKIKIENDKTLNLSLELFENAEQLKEIVVKGYVSLNEKVVSVGKMTVKPLDLPQSMVTIDKQTLDNQQVLCMSDVLMNTNGVYIMGTTGGYQEEIAGRGFSFGSSNTFKNGVRYFNGMSIEMSNIERVEVLKGGSAILFGNVAAGGIINLVTKKPKFGFGGEVSMRAGSFGFLKPTLDIYGGIGKSEKAAFRVNGSYEKANSFRKGVSSERFFVNPSLLFKIGSKTDILIETDYIQGERAPDFGAGIVNYAIVDLPRERFLGVAWSSFKAAQMASMATITHRFLDNWKLNFTGAYRNYKTDLFANTRPNSGTLITKEGTWIRNIQRSEVSEGYYLTQLDLIGNFKTGKIGHQFLLGTDNDHFTTLTTAYNPIVRYDTINIYGTKQYGIRTDIPNVTAGTLTTAPVSRVGIYVQDLISLTSKLKFLAGVRYSYQDTKSDVYTYSTQKTASTVYFDGAFSPRFGLVFQPNRNHSAFASYTNTFTLNTGVDILGNALPPSLIDQYEIGVKNEFFKGKASVNLTAYRIDNDNLAQASLANGNTNTTIRELAGSVRSEGIELDVAAHPLNNVYFMAGYSYNKTKYLRSNTFVEGSLLKYNPNHTANASVNYRFEEGKWKGLSVGLTGVYIGERYAGRSTRIQVANDAYRIVALPNYIQLDGTIGYTYKNISLRGKIGNIFDVLSYNVHDDNSVNPITPRNYSASLSLKF